MDGRVTIGLDGGNGRGWGMVLELGWAGDKLSMGKDRAENENGRMGVNTLTRAIVFCTCSTPPTTTMRVEKGEPHDEPTKGQMTINPQGERERD